MPIVINLENIEGVSALARSPGRRLGEKAGIALLIDDRKLIARAVCREPDAFSDLYLKYQPGILRYTYSVVGNRQEAEDITAETFLRAWRAIERFEDRGFSLLSWLYKIAYNLCIGTHRRRSSNSALEDFKDLLVDDDPTQSPELVAELEWESSMLAHAISALPMIQRQVILLRFVDELSYEEVKRIIGKSNGAIRVMQHRALRTLERLLSESDFESVWGRVTSLEGMSSSGLGELFGGRRKGWAS